MSLSGLSLSGFSSQVRGLSRLCDERKFIQELLHTQAATCQRLITPLRRKGNLFRSCCYATATCQRLITPLRRKEIYSGAVSYAGSNVSEAYHASATKEEKIRMCATVACFSLKSILLLEVLINSKAN